METRISITCMYKCSYIQVRNCTPLVNGPSSRLLFKFRSGTNGLFEELGRLAKGVGSQECPNCGACRKSVEHVLFECASYDSQR